MRLTLLIPKKALNQAYLKEKVKQSDIDLFKENLRSLLESVDKPESEEHAKNEVITFLYDTYYKGINKINTKGRIDLAIYEVTKPVVLIEAKRPGAVEMITKSDFNKKALHELILYYLQERVEENNTDIKYLIATDIYEWFVFDASLFDKRFYQNKKLLRDYTDWKNGRKPGTDRPFFYNEIVKPFLESFEDELVFTWFDLREVKIEKPVEDDEKLIPVYKLFSPPHLLKLPFANDSNTLDKKFYNELLHIIGLEEIKEGSKKVIQRKAKPDPGSLLENSINILSVEDRLRRVQKIGSFGETNEERLFNVALQLCITWIDRILFLKLLEGQLLNYHGNDRSYRFMDYKTIHDNDELNKLFFQVLAVKADARAEVIRKKFSKVPYLNSSLFDINQLEDDTIRINSLDDSLNLDLYKGTVLKNEKGKPAEGKLPTLQYLFEFLDAYDFSSDSSQKIQEENKNLINASVLGLIFEKINGYKDGSYFTPGFITMYMCRETIRRAVVRKFNERYGIDSENLDDLKNFVTRKFKTKEILEFNKLINELTICDPAVGSGHFLVSALNEIITIKSELGILAGRDGGLLRGYKVEVVNDDLLILNPREEFFEYKPGNKESQGVQEALFHEKETIIENCLFGVDINPNSVKICRLRLWIELLKSAYYTAESNYTELETLPNIDINIKQGNSLISRFSLDEDLSKALKSIKYSIDDYRAFVNNYKNATDKEEKRGFATLINQIKSDFRTEIGKRDPKIIRKNKLGGELFNLLNQVQAFGLSEKEKKDQDLKKEKLEKAINKLAAEIEEILNSAIFKDAFEWRFEFPEVLDEEGNFRGFDVVIGNPPYIRQEEIKEFKPWFKENLKLYSGTSDIYVFFIERGFDILKQKGIFTYIMPNKFMQAGYGKPARQFLLEQQILEIIDFGDLQVFDEATTYPLILSASKQMNRESFQSMKMQTLNSMSDFQNYVKSNRNSIKQNTLTPDTWVISNFGDQVLLKKVNSIGKRLKDYLGFDAKYGIKTGLTEAFVIDEKQKEKILKTDNNSSSLIRPFLSGREIKPYASTSPSKSLIKIEKGYTNQTRGGIDPSGVVCRKSSGY